MTENLREVITETGEIIQTLPQLIPTMEDNPLHQLYSILGCNLDYVPIHKYEAFLMCLQFAAASLFLFMFARACFKLMCSALRGGL